MSHVVPTIVLVVRMYNAKSILNVFYSIGIVEQSGTENSIIQISNLES